MMQSIIEIEKTDSTNELLKTMLRKKNIPEYSVVWSMEQTNGKGQTGNKWESEPYKNLTFSILLKPNFIDPSEIFIISKVVSVAIVDTLNRLGDNFTIKWPNDIYHKDKKVGGILIENLFSGSSISNSIVGIGINVNQTTFISDAPNPESLKQIFKREFELSSLLQDVISNISNEYNGILLNHKNINSRYFSLLYRNNDFHTYKTHNLTFKAKIIDVANDGKLSLLDSTGNKRYFYFKEVEFIIP